MTTVENEGAGAPEGPESREATGAGDTAVGRRTRVGRALLRTWRRSGGRHVRLVASAAAVLVTAGAVGGYVGLTSTTRSSFAGRPTVHGPHVDAAASQSGPADSVGGASGSDATGSGAIACPMIPGGADATGDDIGLGSATHLFTRTTADGVTIRAYHQSSTGLCTCDALGSDGVSVELSDDAAVGQGELLDPLGPSATTANTVTEPIGATASSFGVPEGAPVWWVAVSVGPEIASAEMTFGDGSTDQMSPIDGVAVLAHQIDPSVASSGDGPYEVRGTLQLFDSSGAVVKTVTFPTPVSVPVPEPVPTPDPLPDDPPMTVARSTPSNSAPAVTSPPASTGSVAVCPEATAPVKASAG